MVKKNNAVGFNELSEDTQEETKATVFVVA